jgi:paraquat-inducible protein A
MTLLGCARCGLVSECARPDGVCPRCGHALHLRKPESLERCSAFLLAAAMLYVPSNLLPVVSTRAITGEETHTLFGGVLELWDAGSWDLAAIVFIASLVVPMTKMLALAILVVSARRRSTWRQRERAGLVRLLDAIGHWSMLDVFVVVLLAGMVRLEPLAGITPEPGLLAFGAVVVFTILAADSFDPKLIWQDGDG